MTDDHRRFINRNDVGEFPHIDDASAVWSTFGVTRQRTYVFINDDGSWRTAGYGSLRSDVEGLIAQ